MAYWVYEDGRSDPHKVVVHAGDCVACRHGLGPPGGGPPRGEWHGPFGTLDEANEYANSMPGIKDRSNHPCVLKLLT